jgi:hypothetical protein
MGMVWSRVGSRIWEIRKSMGGDVSGGTKSGLGPRFRMGLGLRGFTALVFHDPVFYLHLFFRVVESFSKGVFPCFPPQCGFFRGRKVFIAGKQIVNYETENSMCCVLGDCGGIFCLIRLG